MIVVQPAQEQVWNHCCGVFRHADWTEERAQLASLLLTLRVVLCLLCSLHHLTKHHHAVALHDRDAGETLAILETVHHERLLRREDYLRHLISLEAVGLLHLLASSLLAHLPDKLLHAHSRAPGTHEAHGGVAALQLTWVVQHLDLRGERADLLKSAVLFVDHHVTSARHVVFVETLHIQADVVASLRVVTPLVMHLASENFAGAGVGGSVRW